MWRVGGLVVECTATRTLGDERPGMSVWDGGRLRQ
jgi:hypothetical protein